MKNTLSVITCADGRVQTDFVTIDGVTSMEIHRKGLHDSKVLRRIQEKKFYQYFEGEWILTFPEEHKVIIKPTFDDLIASAQEYIFFRDNNIDYSGFC